MACAAVNRRILFRKFCQHSSLNSLKYLQNDFGLIHWGLWTCINLLLMCISVIFTLTLWEKLTESPTVTSMQNNIFPVNKIPFPAISICNINKISKRKAHIISNQIAESTGINAGLIDNYMQTLTNFYNFNGEGFNKILAFQKILDRFTKNSSYHITKLMKSLTPTCDEFISDCIWKRKLVKCGDIFQMRLTFEGFCCMFNYVKITSEMNKTETNPLKGVIFGDAGLDNGLKLQINNQLDDYFYTKQSSVGANIHVFIPTDYPDKNSGSLEEHLVGNGVEFLLEIEAITFRTVTDAIKYPLEKRQCYFSPEKSTRLGSYSESDCLVDCKIESLLNLCQCVPWTIPIADQDLICDLSDLPCLHQYKTKWDSFSPPNPFESSEFLTEAYNSLRCDERCYPVCDATYYDINTNSAPLRNPKFGNNSILHIFYRNRFSTIYQQDVVYHWFEILSNFGGTFGLVIGFSFISLVEVLFFTLINLWGK